MASKIDYSPVDSGDDTAHSLLSNDEKDYTYQTRRPTTKRINIALKAFFLLFGILLHTILIFALARWLFPVTSDPSNTSTAGPEDESCLMRDTYHIEHSFEGTPRDPVKNPDAVFQHVDPCGSTASEARARGCRFGMLYGAWLPEQCWDQQSEDNFKQYGDWKFWLQPNRTEELGWDEVATGEYDYVLVEWEFHQRHCAEMNRRIFTAVAKRGLTTIDSYLSRWQHTDHCSSAAMIQKPYHELAGLLWRKFPDCGLIEWKEGALDHDGHDHGHGRHITA